MLSRTLRTLESVGLVDRRVTQSRAITLEYSLNNLEGQSSLPQRNVALGKSDAGGRGTAEVTFSNI